MNYLWQCRRQDYLFWEPSESRRVQKLISGYNTVSGQWLRTLSISIQATPVVQQVRGSLGADEKGLIMTTSDFSAGARKEALRSDATHVALMNGEQLVALLVENEIGAGARKKAS